MKASVMRAIGEPLRIEDVDARRALAPIVGSFTEGTSAADGQEGRQLLAELS